MALNAADAVPVTLQRLEATAENEGVALLAEAFRDDPFVARVAARAARPAAEAATILLRYNVAVAAALDWPMMGAWHPSRLVGVAILAPPLHRQAWPVAIARHYERAAEQLGAEAIAFVERIAQWTATQRPLHPHWRLAALAVQPAMQGRGIGAQLLAWVQREAGEGQSVWVETQSATAADFYQRHGYRLHSYAEFMGLPFWTLKRC